MENNVDRELNSLALVDLKKIKRNVAAIQENIEKEYRREQLIVEKKYCARTEVLNNYLSELDYYSTFPLSIMGSAIANMFTLYKGEEYFYDYEWKEDASNIPTMRSFVQSTINKRKKVCFEWKHFDVKKDITFYKFLSSGDGIFEHCLFNYYPFIRDFVDYIVEYRIRNEVPYAAFLSGTLMDLLISKYVVLHKEEIIEMRKSVFPEHKASYEAALKLILAKMPEEK